MLRAERSQYAPVPTIGWETMKVEEIFDPRFAYPIVVARWNGDIVVRSEQEVSHMHEPRAADKNTPY